MNDTRFLVYQYLFTTVASLWLITSRQKSKRKAILRYNSLFDKMKQKDVSLGLQPVLLQPLPTHKGLAGGLGLLLQF